MFRGIKIVAVLVGVALDWYLTLVMSTILGACGGFEYVINHHGTSMDPTEVVKMTQTGTYVVIGSILGTAASIVGGFITGWMARSERVKNGFVTGLVSAVLSGILVHLQGTSHPLLDVFMTGATILAGGLGGYLANLAYGKPPRPPTG